MLPRGPLKLDLDVLPRGPLKLNLDVLCRGPMVWKVLFISMCAGLLPQYLQNKYFQLVTELFIEKTLAYLANAPSLGHIP